MLDNKEFTEYIYSRIEKTLIKDPDYVRLQDEVTNALNSGNMVEHEDLSIQMELTVGALSYEQGFKDAIKLMGGSF